MKYITLTTDGYILVDNENNTTSMYMKGNRCDKIKNLLFLKHIKLECNIPVKTPKEIFNLIDKIIK